jgi:hypothetical protein
MFRDVMMLREFHRYLDIKFVGMLFGVCLHRRQLAMLVTTAKRNHLSIYEVENLKQHMSEYKTELSATY